MLSFVNDYCEGATEKILRRLSSINYDKHTGYGNDDICASAQERIRTACGCPDAEVFFLVGGTQTNQVVIDAVLKPYEGVCAATSGHVNQHEAGAIEYTGHKVLSLPAVEGKVRATTLEDYVLNFFGDESHEHMVFPGMLYISQPTEYGTLYTVDELTELREVCDRFHMTLYIDGARLGYALAAAEKLCGAGLPTLTDIAKLADVFYIGGTKCGALFGEAVVFTKHNTPAHFTTLIKKHGAMLAKGWLLGVQFDELFTDDLYLKISHNAIDMADRLRAALEAKDYTLYMENPTNQVFVVLDDSQLTTLAAQVNFGIWERLDADHCVVRFCTSWATGEGDLESLIELL